MSERELINKLRIWANLHAPNLQYIDLIDYLNELEREMDVSLCTSCEYNEGTIKICPDCFKEYERLSLEQDKDVSRNCKKDCGHFRGSDMSIHDYCLLNNFKQEICEEFKSKEPKDVPLSCYGCIHSIKHMGHRKKDLGNDFCIGCGHFHNWEAREKEAVSRSYNELYKWLVEDLWGSMAYSSPEEHAKVILDYILKGKEEDDETVHPTDHLSGDYAL